MVDLHVHSTFSDGSDTPEQLVALAVSGGLRAMALTDHDNLHGVPSFFAACREKKMTGISGVEISAEVPAGTLHILGYGVNPNHAEFLEQLDRVLDGRAWRNEKILARLNELGCTLTWDEVAALAGSEVVGRPHFAQAMVARGYVASVHEAFDRFLTKGAPAYVDRYRLTPAEGIRLTRAAGGVAVMAHPYTWQPEDTKLESALRELQTLGLGGIEAYYPDYMPERTVTYLRLARKLGLVATGGTDYHGAAKPDLRLGSARGHFATPDEVLAPLLAAMPSHDWVIGA
jgi:hypothetical protein